MLWSNIVLIGGLANAVGLNRRLAKELREIAPDDVSVNIWGGGGDRGEEAIRAGVNVALKIATEESVRRRKRRKKRRRQVGGGEEGEEGERKAE